MKVPDCWVGELDWRRGWFSAALSEKLSTHGAWHGCIYPPAGAPGNGAPGSCCRQDDDSGMGWSPPNRDV